MSAEKVAMKAKFLNFLTDSIVWFAALSIASAVGLLLSEIMQH